jgi:hypothetical protein
MATGYPPLRRLQLHHVIHLRAKFNSLIGAFLLLFINRIMRFAAHIQFGYFVPVSLTAQYNPISLYRFSLNVAKVTFVSFTFYSSPGFIYGKNLCP